MSCGVAARGRLVVLLLALACSAALGGANRSVPRLGGAQSATPEAYSEKIAGSLVTFDMVPVPAGVVTIDGKTVSVPAFYIGRREATWDMYDVFALGLDTPKPSERRRCDRASITALWRARLRVGPCRLSGDQRDARRGRDLLRMAVGENRKAVSSTDRGGVVARREPRDWWRTHAGAQGYASPGIVATPRVVRTRSAARRPDAFGLFDLFGNAAEWVTTADDARVLRGGSFRDAPDAIGPAARAVQDDTWNERDPQLPGSRWWLSDAPFAGFRIVREM